MARRVVVLLRDEIADALDAMARRDSYTDTGIYAGLALAVWVGQHQEPEGPPCK